MMKAPWAKLGSPVASEADRLWLSLVDHSADVAAVLEAMLRVPIVGKRLARLAGRAELPDVWRARLCAHAALHDFGKANRGFQARCFSETRVGHVGPGLALLYSESSLAARLADVLAFGELHDWGAFEQALRAIAAHHGSPITQLSIEAKWRNDLRRLWAPGPDYDPIGALAPLAAAVRDWFPAAYTNGAPLLPENPQFWHAFAGLVMLADWIGSDTDSFPLEQLPDRMAWSRERAPQVLVEYGFDPSPTRSILPAISFASISGHEPHPVQRAVGEADGQIVILEAETGSGKTEGALYRFARLFAAGEVDGLYFALPTRVAAKSLYDRVRQAVDRMFPEGRRPAVILAVPGYVRVDGIAGKPMPGFEVLWDDNATGAAYRARWAAEHPKRFLAGTIAVGTIDQALLGAIQVKHAHMRSSSLLRHLLVVDEVHASDVYMERLLTSLLEQHTRAGGHALLLSATLGSAARLRLLGRDASAPIALQDAERLAYPAISTSADPIPRANAGSGRKKTVQLALDTSIADPVAIAQLALGAAEQGAKVLVVRNLHRTAVATAQALMEIAPDHPTLFRCKGVATLHHGRFAREDRELLDASIEDQMKEGRATAGLVLIGTQTLEQSLDICADLLITDLCPADVLLQRLGRLHRHESNVRPPGFETARAIVLSPPDLSRLLARADFGLGGAHGPYRDLVVLEATRRLIDRYRAWEIPRMNRMLVEHVTHPDALAALTTKLAERDPRWRESRQGVEGNAIADAQIAASARLRWTSRFDSDELAFPSGANDPDDARYGTRLGANDLMINSPEGTIGPFGERIQAISIPSFWLGGIDPEGDLVPTIGPIHPDRIVFTIQGRPFIYDRLGLQRA